MTIGCLQFRSFMKHNCHAYLCLTSASVAPKDERHKVSTTTSSSRYFLILAAVRLFRPEAPNPNDFSIHRSIAHTFVVEKLSVTQ
jgi:hypothetical protein